MLKKNQIDLAIFVCVTFTGQEVHGRFRNGSIILVSKETVRLRRWESVKRKICFKGRIASLKGLEADPFSTVHPSSGGISLMLQTSDFQTLSRSGDSINSFGKTKFSNDCNKQDNIENSFSIRLI